MKKVLLALSFVMVFGLSSLMAQTRTITGTVTGSDDGMPIPGASVFVKGTTVGTVTLGDGNYSLNVPQDAETLVISFVGMQSQEVAIAGRSVIDVALAPSSIAMDEVVVVAYGTQTKKSLTGSQVAIKGDDLQKAQVSNITRALEGAVAGVQTTSSSGQPGTGATVRIRGMGSLSASSSPLYVVDGMAYEGNINNLSQVDIESMTVLKDASATSLYGSRAANGVILITTKRGTGGKPRVVVDSRVGVNTKAYKGYDIMTNPQEYYETFWEGLRNDRYYGQGDSYVEAGYYASERLIKYTNPSSGAIEWMLGYNNYNVPDNQVIDPLTGKLNPNASLLYQEKWEDEIFENGVRQEHSVSMSGTNGGTNYFMSFNYLNDEGYSPNTGFERYTTRLKLAQDVNKWLKLNSNIAYIHTEVDNPESSGMSSANVFYVSQVVAPIYPVYQRNIDGTFRLDSKGQKQYDFGDNDDMKRPVMSLSNPGGTQKLNTTTTALDRLSLNASAEVTFTKDIKFVGNIGIDNAQTNTLYVYNREIGQYAATGGYIGKSSSITRTINTNQILSFNKEINDVHSISAKVGHELYKWNYSYNFGSKKNFLFSQISELDWAVVMSEVSSHGHDYSLESYFGHVNYGYLDKYFLDGSVRYDGSSRFHPDNRWGTFWSVGASWIMNQEGFLSNATFIDVLKMRASYGSVGNDNLGEGYYYYAYEDQYDVVNNDGEIGLKFAFKGNKDLKWESNKSLTVGFDFGLFDRITGNIDYFNRTSSDLLFILPQAPSTGINSIPYNLGKLSNKGFELEVHFDIIKKNDLKLSMAFNATTYQTTIEELPEMYKEEGLARGSYQKWEEGSSPYLYFMRKYAGVNPDNGKSLWVSDVKDTDGNITGTETTENWNDATRYSTGKDATPDLFGGVSLTLDYKGFDLTVQTAYQIGGWVYDGAYASFMHSGSSDDVGANWHRDILKRWTPSNTDTDVPIVDRDPDGNNISDRFLTKGDYLSLRNVVLGYTLPQRITSKVDIESLRFYVVADNLWFMSRRQGFDPRMYYSGVVTSEDMNYSPIKTISVGVNLTF